MAKDLLDGVNEVLQRVHILDISGSLATLTDEGKQTSIDLAIQVWNEQIDELFSTVGIPHPNQFAENTITLSTSDRDYALQTDVTRLLFPLLDETNGRYIVEYPGGYWGLVRDQPIPSNFTGLPVAGAIRPTDGELYLDRLPTSDENGLVYKYLYEKDTALSGASDTMPFTDATFRALVPAVAEMWKLYRQGKEAFSQGSYRQSIGRAARLVTQRTPNTSWTPRHVGRFDDNPMDPLDG